MMANIEKRGASYRVRYRTPEGRSRNKSFDRRVDAQRFATSVENSKLVGTYVDPSAGRKTFGKWWFECERSTVDLRPSTRARDESYGRQYLLPRFEHTPIGRIDHLAVKTWVAELSARGLAPATVVKAAQLLGRTLRAAVDAGLIPANTAERVGLPRIERHEMRFLTPAQVAVLADTIDERYRAFVWIMAYGGLRPGEMFALRGGRVDVLHGRIDVAETVVEVKGRHHVGPPKTKAGRRSVPLPRSVLAKVEDYVTSVPPGAVLFPAPEGGYVRASLFRRRFWYPACVAAGLGTLTKAEDGKIHYDGLRIHDLRHTAIGLWIAAAASPNEIAARAGHESVVTVLDRYGHLLPGTGERVNDALDAMIMVSPTPDSRVIPFARERS